MKVNRQILLDFILNETTEEQQKQMLQEIRNCEIIRQWYLKVKRELDAERYINDEMSIHEKIEFEEILKVNIDLREYLDLSSEINVFLRIEAFRECLNQILMNKN